MKNFPDLENKSVLVTGGSKGIGRDIALSFAKNGAKVVIVGRDEEALQQTTEELRKFNRSSFYVSADLNNVSEIQRMTEAAADYMGSLDVLVNNAGINRAKPAMEVTEEDWDLTLDTNLKAAFFCSQKAAEYMIPNQSGKIVNIASQMAFVGYYKRAAYCASKGGMVQLTKALAVEWASHGINVNAVAPTFIETELTSKMFEDKEFEKEVYSRIPLGKLADAGDVSAATLFLSSNLSKFITGDTIKVDGGWTAI
ncbi:SDR family oxidoreductase [Cytobacillus oceanisediminis]|uniref:SDR family NAD(P)-dependent oxidoreductase n=1 Tax=Cytobacillus TaxID=2675230 RepID=UPI00203E733F|nr:MULTISPECIES: SDR family NAD(P)-dependent oxidoreductase [Cytobacillus]MBY0159345.1 SDR family oxidoreductase [Cytobacillus firmus]MCM3391580.1 SDR family oxidoreductase [Cytobacillus oceanisediminis]MCM3529007.1 SDR family oxidoreductase [Cytobacillus oceanisediminis]UQX53712.1 SDR family oxidoreductase [Cytobacillus pseudoceanisediminis]